jgi:hypothetical protein
MYSESKELARAIERLSKAYQVIERFIDRFSWDHRVRDDRKKVMDVAEDVAGAIEEVVRILSRIEFQVKTGYHVNPGHCRVELVRKMSPAAHAVLYEHEDDGKPYRHDFGDGVELWAGRDDRGRHVALIRHRHGRPVWEDM